MSRRIWSARTGRAIVTRILLAVQHILSRYPDNRRPHQKPGHTLVCRLREPVTSRETRDFVSFLRLLPE